jgi:hypothetical protein
MFMLGILPIWCFFADCLRLAFLFFRGAAFALDFGFGLLMPGMFPMSCPWASIMELIPNARIAPRTKQRHILFRLK